MFLTTAQCNRIAILIENGEDPPGRARVVETPTHFLDGSVFCIVDGQQQTVSVTGDLVPYVENTLGLVAA